MSESPPPIYCANHPSVETSLRCNKCEKPICAKCAVLTPTGYRCRECVKEQQKVYETALWYDYPVVFIVVSILAYLGSLLGGLIGRFGYFSLILALFLAPAIGGLIAQAARAVTRRRRSKKLFLLAAIAAVVGCLPVGLQLLQHFSLFAFIFIMMYAVLMTSALYYRLSGIRIG
jgi:hypothetical protein